MSINKRSAGELPRPHGSPGKRLVKDEQKNWFSPQLENPLADGLEEDEVVGGGVGDEYGSCSNEVIQSWNPLTGDRFQELVMDRSAYKMHHDLTPEWPSLSFDFLRDDLGESRTRFPHTLTAVVGTQASQFDENQLTVIKLTKLGRIQAETEEDFLGEEYSPGNAEDLDDVEDSDDEGADLDPFLKSVSIPHSGGTNRIRSMPQNSHIVATWSDLGQVNVFDIDCVISNVSEMEKSDFQAKSAQKSELKPFFVHSKHSTEGYALDWSPIKEGVMASGDCAGSMHVWTPRSEGGYEVVPSYESKMCANMETPSSVEDIQWSPTEATVFCTAECGGFVQIFDTRAPNQAMLSQRIHSDGADVNVASWNGLVTNLLACGGDDRVLSVWDLRQFSGRCKPLARFAAHKTPITSVEWHPTDESMLVASDDVATYIYDLSVEEDSTTGEQDAGVPPQLLFVHCGSEQFKEVHWHPQITSCLMTTALSGFSVFIPSNL